MSEKRYYRGLDGMRGVAAICVFFWHSNGISGAPSIVGSGYLAVDIFFCLSGIVLANAYDEKLKSGTFVRPFMLHRIVRLYPLYVLGTLFGAILAFGGIILHANNAWRPGTLGVAMLLSIFMIPTALREGAIYPLNNPAWSLFFELAVNLFYGLFAPQLRRNAMLLAIISISGVLYFLSIQNVGNANLGGSIATFLCGFPRAIFSFFCGVAIWRLLRTAPHAKSNVLAMLAIVFTAGLCSFHPGVTRTSYDELSVLFIAPIIVGLGVLVEPYGKFATACSIVGRISFPLYAVHSSILQLGKFVWAKKISSGPVEAEAWILILLLGTVGFAWILDKYFDPPARRYVLNVLRKFGRFSTA